MFDSDQLQKVVWSSRVCTAAAKDHKEGCETLQVAEVNFGRVVHFPNLAISEHDGATGSVVDGTNCMPIKELAIHALADIGICARGHIFWWKVYRNDDADVVATLL